MRCYSLSTKSWELHTSRFQYTGQAAIPELGLLYYKARFYNPALGRFMQTDPVGYEDDINLYTYVRNDPMNGLDPFGLATYMLGVSGDAFFLFGFGFDVGLYMNPGIGNERFDIGLFAGGRMGVGADLSLSLVGSRLPGEAENINGGSLSYQVGASAASFGQTALISEDASSASEGQTSGGFGASALPIGGHVSLGVSGKLGWGDLVDGFKAVFGNDASDSLQNAASATVRTNNQTGISTATFEAKTGTRIAPRPIEKCTNPDRCSP